MDPAEAARRWADGWKAAWLASDEEAVGRLYAEPATFRSHPAREPHPGRGGIRGYARQAFADEEAEAVWFGDPVGAAGDRAAVEYWATLRSEGKELTLAGVALLRFDADGLVADQRDYWTMWEGRRDPWEGWGRA
jgi:ketosteroid isomerase-like protein